MSLKTVSSSHLIQFFFFLHFKLKILTYFKLKCSNFWLNFGLNWMCHCTVTALLGLGILQWFLQMDKSYRLNNYFSWWSTEDERKFIVAALNTIQYFNIDLWEVTYLRVYNPCEGCKWRCNQVKSNRSFLTVLVFLNLKYEAHVSVMMFHILAHCLKPVAIPLLECMKIEMWK